MAHVFQKKLYLTKILPKSAGNGQLSKQLPTPHCRMTTNLQYLTRGVVIKPVNLQYLTRGWSYDNGGHTTMRGGRYQLPPFLPHTVSPPKQL